jgi:endonuclease YncB( thermonuclease family)
MLTRLIPLLVLCGALNVLGQDAPTPATYTFGLEHVAIHGRITGVVDGDTINVLIQAKQPISVHRQIRVRIAFIDAPEKGQAFGQRAKQAMSELIFGKEVKLRPHTIDRDGRLVARVLIDD